MTTATTGTRLTWMDAVRGTAILLLLVWHASAVPELYGQAMPEVVRRVNAVFMPYRMPTLMLLSGMLLGRSLSKPLPKYYAGKFAMIIWPYVVWVLIAKWTFLDVAGMPWWHWRAWYATSYLWFLFFIAVFYVVAPALSRLPPWLPVAVAAAISTVTPAGSTEQRMAYFAVFFFAGDAIARHPEALAATTRSLRVYWFVLPVAALAVASSMWTRELHYQVWTAPISLAGMVLLAALFSRTPSSSASSMLLQTFGRSSLIYYVSHFPVMALISMHLASRVEPLALAAINLAAALAVGWVLAMTKAHPPVRWLFEAPKAISRKMEKATAFVSRGVKRRPLLES